MSTSGSFWSSAEAGAANGIYAGLWPVGAAKGLGAAADQALSIPGCGGRTAIFSPEHYGP